jgi:hypothetical protein
VVGDRSGRDFRNGRAWFGRPRLRPRQLRWIGVEAEADLTAALLDERRKSISEIGQGL